MHGAGYVSPEASADAADEEKVRPALRRDGYRHVGFCDQPPERSEVQPL